MIPPAIMVIPQNEWVINTDNISDKTPTITLKEPIVIILLNIYNLNFDKCK